MPPQPPAQPARRQFSTRGPKILTFIGIGVLVLGITGIAMSIYVMVSLVPSGIMSLAGHPGSAVVASTEVPGETTVEGTAGSPYTLWIASETSTPVQTTRADIEILDETGKQIDLRGPSVSGTRTYQSHSAQSLATFTAPTTGTYTVKVTRAPGIDTDESIFIAPASGFGSFFTGVFGSVGLMLFGIFSLIIGGGLGAGGGIWWGTTVSSRKKQQQGLYY